MPINDPHNELKSSITALITETLAVPGEQITAELSYGDLPEWDSLGHMNIMMALEEKYGLQITTELITSLVSVKAITAYLLEHKHA